MACAVIDRAIQMHGGGGLSQDHFLAQAYAGARSLRLADGPDEVHIAALARSMLKASMTRPSVGAAVSRDAFPQELAAYAAPTGIPIDFRTLT